MRNQRTILKVNKEQERYEIFYLKKKTPPQCLKKTNIRYVYI